MNPFAKFKENPKFDSPEDHGDLWEAIHRCYTRIAVVDERVRVALMFGLPIVGFLVAVQLACLGVLLR